MQKLVYFVMLLAAMFCPAISRGADAVNAPKKGVIRVKLQPEVALKVGNAPLTQSRGAVTTGITPLDRAARDVKAVSIRPMLPYVQKFARQRANMASIAGMWSISMNRSLPKRPEKSSPLQPVSNALKS